MMMMQEMPIGSYGIIDKSSNIKAYADWLIRRISLEEVEAVGQHPKYGWTKASANTLPVRLPTEEELLKFGIVYYGSQKTLWSPR